MQDQRPTEGMTAPCEINLIGEKYERNIPNPDPSQKINLSSIIYFCPSCECPGVKLARLEPCSHLFCLECAAEAQKKKVCCLASCHRRADKYTKIRPDEYVYRCNIFDCSAIFFSSDSMSRHILAAHRQSSTGSSSPSRERDYSKRTRGRERDLPQSQIDRDSDYDRNYIRVPLSSRKGESVSPQEFDHLSHEPRPDRRSSISPSIRPPVPQALDTNDQFRLDDHSTLPSASAPYPYSEESHGRERDRRRNSYSEPEYKTRAPPTSFDSLSSSSPPYSAEDQDAANAYESYISQYAASSYDYPHSLPGVSADYHPRGYPPLHPHYPSHPISPTTAAFLYHQLQYGDFFNRAYPAAAPKERERGRDREREAERAYPRDLELRSSSHRHHERTRTASRERYRESEKDYRSIPRVDRSDRSDRPDRSDRSRGDRDRTDRDRNDRDRRYPDDRRQNARYR